MNFQKLIFAAAVTFSVPAFASTIPTEANCAPGEQSVSISLKESFRYYPERRDGTHRFLFLVGCVSDQRLNASIFTGRELDKDYTDVTPEPIDGSVNELPFSGSYLSAKIPQHGNRIEIVSSNHDLQIEGNFNYNRDISYRLNEVTVPASTLTRELP